MQIYDCETGVVKCLAVYFHQTPILSKPEGTKTQQNPM
ncbi:hypothetical protein FEM08_17620 [Flavobacterium gilvum]|nr:hypothetical protein FEM08_17620 [Flavobacterium gilvum]